MSYCAMQMYWESEEKLHAFLILPLDAGELSVLHPSFVTSAKVTGIQWIRRLWVPEAVWMLGRRAKTLSQLGNESHFSIRLASSLVTIFTELLLFFYLYVHKMKRAKDSRHHQPSTKLLVISRTVFNNFRHCHFFRHSYL